MFCVDLWTNSDYFSLQQSLIGFYNRGRECLLRGTNWVFKSDRYSFVLKVLIHVSVLVVSKGLIFFLFTAFVVWGRSIDYTELKTSLAPLPCKKKKKEYKNMFKEEQIVRYGILKWKNIRPVGLVASIGRFSSEFCRKI